MSHHRVAVTGLQYRYPEGPEALKGIDFEIGHGESVALVGGNGAGKSTLLQHLAGLLTADAGRVEIGELTVTARSLDTVRRSVGLLFQDPDDQLFMPTVLEEVAFGPLNLGMEEAEALACAQHHLEEVEGWHLRDRPPYRLSGGEKRRVALAAVLALAPSVLVLDEPSAGLDPAARRHLMGLLARFDHTRIIASHDLELVLELCPRTLMLAEGRLIADGPTRDLLTDDTLLTRCRLERPPSLRPCPACGATAPSLFRS